MVLRQLHRAGEKCFVDFCDGISLIDADTGELIPTQLFVGALGASSYTFAFAKLSQELPVWLDCHVRMFEFFCGVSALIVCDNLRAGVTHPDRYEAEVNRSYRELATHYGTCVIPTRVRKPRADPRRSRSPPPRGRGLDGRRVDRCRVLVYGVDFIRQPGHHHRPLTDGYLCRHSTP